MIFSVSDSMFVSPSERRKSKKLSVFDTISENVSFRDIPTDHDVDIKPCDNTVGSRLRKESLE